MAVAAAAVSGACGGSGSKSPAAQEREVEIKDFAFGPKEIRVEVGGTVRWTNRDAFKHTVTSGAVDGPENKPDGRFDEDLEDAGAEATATFDEPGRFTYFCKQHNAMDGVVVVTPHTPNGSEK
jgi:plastocyanin